MFRFEFDRKTASFIDREEQLPRELGAKATFWDGNFYQTLTSRNLDFVIPITAAVYLFDGYGNKASMEPLSISRVN